jgi:hypothetical protein
MERVSSSPASEQDLSAALIQRNTEDVEGQPLSAASLAGNIENDAQAFGVENQQLTAYINTLREMGHRVTVAALPEGVGGQFDGRITMAHATTEVTPENISSTIDCMKEVHRHEMYHATNGHLEGMRTMGGDGALINGVSFTSTEIIEGLTVAETGNEFVSDGYHGYEADLTGAIAGAGLSMDRLRRAVNTEKDLGLIDDRRLEEEPVIA